MNSFKNIQFRAVAGALLLSLTPPAMWALSLDLAGVSHRQFSLEQSPLFLGDTPPANVMLMVDDSISMSANFAFSHRDGSGDVEKLGSGGSRDGSRDEAQGMARAADSAALYYPWIYPMPAELPCLDDSNTAIPAALPDENGTPLCGQIAPSYELVEAWNSGTDSTVRDAHGETLLIDTTADLAEAWKLRSSQYNPLYFDPERTYSPWPGVNEAGVAFADASFTAVKMDPWATASTTLNLSQLISGLKSAVILTDGSLVYAEHKNYGNPGGDARYNPAVYYQVNATTGLPEAVDVNTLSAAEQTNFANWFQYYRSRALIAKGVLASLIEQMQGVRVGLATTHLDDPRAQAAVEISGEADSGNKKLLLDKLYQVTAYAPASPLRSALWNAAEYFRCIPDPESNPSTRYSDYYSVAATADTVNVVGDNSCPVLPEAEGGSCQPNHVVMVTDGYSTAHAREVQRTGYPQTGTPAGGVVGETVKNYNDPQGEAVSSNDDGDGDSAHDGGFYADSESDTAADVAMQAYEDDLVSTVSGEQRMQTHVLLMASESGSASLSGILAGSETWPTVFFAGASGQPPPTDAEDFLYANLVSEMRHAALNGRGRFLSGLSDGAASEFQAVFSRITGRELSGTNAAASAASLGDDTLVFLTSYDIEDYSGDVQAFRIGENGEFERAWSAAEQLSDDSGRVILTYDPARPSNVGTGYGSGGVPFTAASLADTSFFGAIPLFNNVTSDLVSALDDIVLLGFIDDIPLLGGLLSLIDFVTSTVNSLLGGVLSALSGLELLEILGLSPPLTADEISYIRGDRSNEAQNGGALRNRGDTVLGPVFSSDPVFVGAPLFDYPDGFEVGAGDQQYHEFAETYANRTPMVYVGANDGMLHGFNAETGEELLAFVPARILSGLREYPDSGFSPRAYVDGKLSIVDVYGKYPACGSGQSCWRTVLVGTLGRGGQGLYALDITDPSTFSEANADDIVLWEFTDKGSLLGSTRTLVVNLITDTLCDALGTGGTSLCNLTISFPFPLNLLLPSINLGNVVEGLLGGIAEDLLDLLIDSEDRGHADLGYTLVQANIVHTGAEFTTNTGGNNDGDWAVIVSNGYNNTEIDLGLLDVDTSLATSSPLSFSVTGNSSVFAIDMESGLLVKQFDTGVGAFLDLGQILDGEPTVNITLPDLTDDASSLLQTINLPVSVPNGMATTAVVDIDADRNVDYVYSGDLTGSLWRIDLTGNVSAWDLYSSGGSATPIFQTTNFAGVPQPITVEPMVKLHPDYPAREGLLLLLGTGEYLESDTTDEIHFRQSFYGLWDDLGANTIGSGSPNLLKRYITKTVTTALDTSLDGSSEQVTLRLISDDLHDGDGDGDADGPIDWSSQHGWHLDLIDGDSDSAQDAETVVGERVVADPVLRNDRILFSSIVPLTGACAPSLQNWLFQLDANNGGPEVFAPFDLNGDGGLTRDDLYDDNGSLVSPGARSSEGAYAPVPTILINSSGQEIHISPTAGGGVERTIANPIGYERSRSTWRQLR